MESYKTIKKQAQAEFIEKRSRFIGLVTPVTCEEDALSFIGEIKAAYPDASHHAYAYDVRQRNIRRYSDNGEPQGTAGIPTLEVLLKNGVTDCAAVVTRYFGGVLLGAGGLVRAYSHAAKIALDAAGIVTMGMCYDIFIRCGYHQYEKICQILHAHGGIDTQPEFGADVKICFRIPKTNFTALEKQLTEYSLGSVKTEIQGDCFAPVE